MGQLPVLGSQMPIGVEIRMATSQLRGTFSHLVEQPSVREELTCIALSMAEAEYITLDSATQVAIWLKQLTNELKNESSDATMIYEDNQSAICISKHP